MRRQDLRSAPIANEPSHMRAQTTVLRRPPTERMRAALAFSWSEARCIMVAVKRFRWRHGVALGVLFGIACQDPTQVQLVVRTNVAYAQGASLAIWASHTPGAATLSAESSDPWLADGEVGDLMVTPGTAGREGPLTLRIAMGLRGKKAEDCRDGDPGCIIARRNLRFVPHTRLKVPVVVYLACEGVRCDEASTCSYLGKCVSASVDPQRCASAEGCPLPDEPPFTGVAAPVPPGPANDASTDAQQDAEASVVPDAAPNSALLLAVASRHACAQLKSGALKCWGENNFGQLGVGDLLNRGGSAAEMGPALPAVDLGTAAEIAELSAGEAHTCARFADGTVKCWGSNAAGQLGLGDTINRGVNANEMGAALPFVNLGTGRSAV